MRASGPACAAGGPDEHCQISLDVILKNIFPVVFHADHLPAPFPSYLKPFV